MTIEPPDFKRYRAAVNFGDFLVEIVFVEERFLAFEQLQAVNVAGHHQLQKFLRPFVSFLLVDIDRVHVGGKDVADGANDHVVFFVDIHGCGQFADPPYDYFPEPKQVGQIAGKFAFCAVAAGGADDKSQSFWRVEFIHDVAEPAAHGFILDFPRHAYPAQSRH